MNLHVVVLEKVDDAQLQQLIIQLILSKDKIEDKTILKNQLCQLEQFLLEEFPNLPIFQQLDVKFQLSNNITQDRRQLVSKIFPNAHDASATLKNCIHCRYQFQISNEYFILAMTEDHVRSILFLKNNDDAAAEWTFYGVTSYIVSTRIEVQANHPFLQYFNAGKKINCCLRFKVFLEDLDKPFNCSICGKKFEKRGNREKHLQQFHSKVCAVFDCHICNATFNTEKSLKRHAIVVHRNQTPFICHICNIEFKHKFSLKKHIVYFHDKRKLFECSICNAKFKTKQMLKAHVLKVHESQKCSICDATFTFKTHLRRHISSVHRDQLFNCSICNIDCYSRSDLKHHKITIHKTQKLFPCSVCNAKFFFKNALKYHLLCIHDKEIVA